MSSGPPGRPPLVRGPPIAWFTDPAGNVIGLMDGEGVAQLLAELG